MAATQADAPKAGMSVWQWLFNPFRRLAGASALAIGLAAIVASALAGWAGRTHFDGVLDIHTGAGAPWWLFVGEGIGNWLSLSIMLVAAGFIVRRSTFRIIDVFGTQALARWPLLFVAAFSAIPPVAANNIAFTEEAIRALRERTFPAIGITDVVFILAMVAVVLVSIVWTVALMYRAYAVSCGTKGARAIISFIAAIILAEALSKFAVYGLFVSAAVATQT